MPASADAHDAGVEAHTGGNYIQWIIGALVGAVVLILAVLWINGRSSSGDAGQTNPQQVASGAPASSTRSGQTVGGAVETITRVDYQVTVPKPETVTVAAHGLSDAVHIPEGSDYCPDPGLGKGSVMQQSKFGYGSDFGSDTPLGVYVKADTVRFHNLADEEQDITVRFVPQGSPTCKVG